MEVPAAEQDFQETQVFEIEDTQTIINPIMETDDAETIDQLIKEMDDAETIIKSMKEIEDSEMIIKSIKAIEDAEMLTNPIKEIEDEEMIIKPMKEIENAEIIIKPVKEIEDTEMFTQPIKEIDDAEIIIKLTKEIDDAEMVIKPMKEIDDAETISKSIKEIEDAEIISKSIKGIEDAETIINPVMEIEDAKTILEPIEEIDDAETILEPIEEIDNAETILEPIEEIVDAETIFKSMKEIEDAEMIIKPLKDIVDAITIIKPIQEIDNVETIIEPIKDIDDAGTIIEPIKEVDDTETIIRLIKEIENSATIIKPINEIKDSATIIKPINEIEDSATIIKPINEIEDSATIIKPINEIEDSATSIKPINETEDSKTIIEPINETEDSKTIIEPIKEIENAETIIKAISEIEDSEIIIKPISEIEDSEIIIKPVKEILDAETIIKYINDCLVPKLAKNYDESERHNEFDTRNNSLNEKIKIVIEALEEYEFKTSPHKETIQSDEANMIGIVSSLLNLYKELLCSCSWNCNNSKDCAEKLDVCFNVKWKIKLEDVLKKNGICDSHAVYDKTLDILCRKLASDDYKKYPGQIEVYCDLVQNIEDFDVTVNPIKILPVALILMDDFIESNKSKGLQCCEVLLKNLTVEDFENGNYYDVIYQSVTNALNHKDVKITELSQACALELCQIFPSDVKDEKLDELYSAALEHLSTESNLCRKATFLNYIKKLMEMLEINCVGHSAFQTVICDTIENCLIDSVAEILLIPSLECVEEWIKYFWPVWKLSVDYKVLCVLLKYYSKGNTGEGGLLAQQLIVTLISLCSPEEQKHFTMLLEGNDDEENTKLEDLKRDIGITVNLDDEDF